MNRRELTIANPCGVDWRSMTPSDGGRFCDSCKKTVKDISQLRERDARALLAQPRNEGLCIRYLADAQGRVWFGGDRVVPASSLLSRAKRAAAVVALPLGMAACGSPDDSGATGQQKGAIAQIDQPEFNEVMGDVAYEPPPVEETDAGSPDASDASDTDANDTDGGEAPDASPHT